jgi:hypothetical protein
VITTISGSVTLPGSSTIGPLGANPAPNNDNSAAASANTFGYTVFWNAITSGEVEYVVANSGGTTEYFVNQTLFNLTGQIWTGFRFELGFGRGSGFVPASGGLDFDLPDGDPAPFSSRFSTLSHQPQTLLWSGGTMANLGAAAFSFSFDVPDNLAALHPGGLSTFTLRQTAIAESTAPVPEPATGLLLAGGVLAVAVLRRRFRAN